jgi:hypothetical protein
MNQQEVKNIGSFHPATMALVQELGNGKPGDEKTDIELGEIIGSPVGSGCSGYGYLQSAIRYCERNGVVWRRVRGCKKLSCLNGLETVEMTTNDLRSLRRKSTRAAARLSTVAPDDIPQDKRPMALALSAQLGAIALMARTDSTKKLLGSNQSKPQIGDAFKLFGNN